MLSYLDIFIIILLFILIILWYAYISGLFYKFDVKTGVPVCFKTIFIGYKFHIGSYRDINKAFYEIESIVPISDNKIIGIYYDDPDKVKKIFSNFKKAYLYLII